MARIGHGVALVAAAVLALSGCAAPSTDPASVTCGQVVQGSPEFVGQVAAKLSATPAFTPSWADPNIASPAGLDLICFGGGAETVAETVASFDSKGACAAWAVLHGEIRREWASVALKVATAKQFDADELTVLAAWLGDLCAASPDSSLSEILASADNEDAMQTALDEAAAGQAAEADADAARNAARTWTLKDPQGYSFTAEFQVGSPTTSFTYAPGYELGAGCGFDPKTDIAVPVTLVVTATTQGFDTPIDVRFGAGQPDDSRSTHGLVLEDYYSSGVTCSSSTIADTVTSGAKWDEPFKTGKSAEHLFSVIILNWKTPATPAGDPGFLDVVRLVVISGMGSAYTSADSRSVSLSNVAYCMSGGQVAVCG